MQERTLNNEEKLEIVYRILIQQEKARIFSQRMRVFKWLILLWIALLILSNPEMMVGKLTHYLQPMVMKSMSGVIQDQKLKSLQDMQKMIQDVQNNDFQ
jgi:hypothetical protein